MNLERFQHDSSMGLTLVLEKHGTGDQKPHGSWATGVSSKVVEDIQRFTREWGGLSISMVDGHQPTNGYMVAKPPEFSRVVDEADFFDSVKGPKILADYLKKNRADLGRGGKDYLGTWLNGGKVYLDVSQNMMNREESIRVGRERNQKAIWDVVNQVEIDTGGTGEVQKGNQGGSTARHLADDGRGNRRLRPSNLGEVGKALKVIRFQTGLKPILKHTGGDAHGGSDDQTSHGNWARGVTGEEDALINQMEGVGPSLDDLENALRMPEQPGMDDLIDFINNNQEFYNAATEGIDERVEERLSNLQQEFPNHEYTEQEKSTIYDDVQREMIEEHAEGDDGSIAQLWQEQNGGGEFNPEELKPFFDDVYAISHEVIDSQGELFTTLSSKTNQIYLDGERLVVTGQVQDSDKNFAGEFQRSFFKSQDKEGNEIWAVEHDLFKMDNEYAGVGFGSKFIAQQEAWYTATGFGRIDVGTAWDGARHWAKSGYDFDERGMRQNVGELLKGRVYNSDDFQEGSANRIEFDNLMSKMVTEYDSAGRSFGTIKTIDSDDFPIPNDFLMIGYADRVQIGNNAITNKPVYSWAGARLLENRNMKYQKGLSKEGRSITQGPIDRDGDGLVYDGTPREKPAPAVN